MDLPTGSLGALRTFAASCCPQNDRKTGGGCSADALTLSVAPPAASDEFSHEIAVGFLFAEEMKIVRQLQAKYKEGKELINVIYCSRSCARAFPPAVAADEADPKKMKQYYLAIFSGGPPAVAADEADPKKMKQYYLTIFSVLHPQMEKIKQLNDYCSQAVVLLSDNIQRTTVHENMTRVIPDVMMDALVDIMDVILQLNHLHDTKSSLRNDFSVFKRVFVHVKDDLQNADLVDKDIVKLQEFMGSSYQEKGSVWDSLRHNLTNVKRYEQVTYLLLRHCVRHIENDTCTTPSSKFKYIRALSYLMAVLVGSDAWRKANTLPGADKKVIEAAVKLITRFPVIPMLHEASIKPVKVLQTQGGYKLESINGAPLKNRDIMFDVVAASRDCKSTYFKKNNKERTFSQIPDRTASASLCQIQMLRTAIDSMVAKRSMGDLNGKSTSSALFSFKKDLDSSDAETLLEFYHKAGVFPVVLDLSATLDELADFSNLWFRELYLELAKSVQIPAEISVPWLLVEQCLNSSSSHIEPVVAILDVYNDAGNCSLYALQQQHLYDEAEAEGKLCFDHFTYLLAERIYLHYKTLAATGIWREWTRPQENSVNIKRASVTKMNSTVSVPSMTLKDEDGDSKYVSVLTQRHIGIFGQNYDLTIQLGQRVDALLGRDLESWFTKFEASDATCYVALLDMLMVLKRTHASLLALGLDDFDDILDEANDKAVECLLGNASSSESSIRTRVHDQISQTVLTDLCQHFSLKFDARRFIRMQLHEALTMNVGDQFAHEECLRKVKQPQLSKESIFRSKIDCSVSVKAAEYGALEKVITGTHRAFFGEPHLEAICELLSHRELADIANDCINFTVAKSSKTIQENVTREEDSFAKSYPHFFWCALERIDSMLKASGIESEWEAPLDSQPEKMPNGSSFYHVWGALEFISCNQPRTQNSAMDEATPLSLRGMFGDGVQFAGCTLMHLLGQRTLYDLWNVSQHVINAHHCEEVKAASDAQLALVSSKKNRFKGDVPSVQSTVGTLDKEMKDKAARFVVNACEMRAISHQIFHTLETAWPSVPRTPVTATPPPFVPPEKNSSTNTQFHQ
ncbi:Cytoplasmic FMR1-interacting protein 1 [Phytophthora megakarya]|uniref:Cytoplasmic FMR1-interacting protein 1 n=1 Tax=Phytophthora megakarya TaxID=4795 RepID=A0A225W0B6_9STRA|nr:Cytoplasmic FMR1-interacting protein 1 [Phytophthora megakarya]